MSVIDRLIKMYNFKITFPHSNPVYIKANTLKEACEYANDKYKREWSEVIALNKECFEEVL